jgi:hypothetical protein
MENSFNTYILTIVGRMNNETKNPTQEEVIK